MPVSKKRKSKAKKPQTNKPPISKPIATARDLLDGLAGHSSYRAELDSRRATVARPAAVAMVAALAETANTRSDAEIEDELCARIGANLARWSQGSHEENIGAPRFAAVIVDAAVEAVRNALDPGAAEPGSEGWLGPWRVLAAVARIVQPSTTDQVNEGIAQLRRLPGGRKLPKVSMQTIAPGSVLLARDVYGSRFGIIAPVGQPDGQCRYYLWDVDVCGHRELTVFSGYFPTAEQAMDEWRAGVGAVAASGSQFTGTDDRWLLAGLLPREEGILELDCEDEGQFAEYHRGRRLAYLVNQVAARSARRSRTAARPPDVMNADSAAEQFGTWLRNNRPELAESLEGAKLDREDEAPVTVAELATELAGSWHLEGPPEVYPTCSPHRIALVIAGIRDYFLDDYANLLISLLPEWVAWLAEVNGTPADLVERCLPAARGETQHLLELNGNEPRYLVRVIE